ncbi:mechanosensitive ion channel domain-containing protein [uncultured Shimia sp.]|uniref:mechanosensitive ion channel domain-containing protein n=1 Tax=uncultured Shimia sp. TaxID=573152 RepID=UPI00261B829F|nr:mechanosensitive ion channel domain-containing protein [uncultured Shimia sp.]
MFILRTLLFLLVLAFTTGSQTAWAQDETTAIDYEEWRKVATRAENAIEAGRASGAAMDELRNQLADWSARFAEAKTRSTISEATLQARLDALGPEPEEGFTEPDEITEGRNTLKKLLSQARVPAVRAEVSNVEADRLIEGIDALLRDRYTSELLKRGPVPISLASVRSGFDNLIMSFSHVIGEVRTAWAYERHSREIGQNLLRFVVFMAIGLTFLIRGGKWTTSVQRVVIRGQLGPAVEIAAFLLSLGFLVFPLIGIFFVSEAFYATDLAGLRGDRVLSTLPQALFSFIVPVWIGRRIFDPAEALPETGILNARQRRVGLRSFYGIGIVVALYQMVRAVAGYDGWNTEARSVVLYPLIVLSCYFLLRVAHVFRKRTIASVEKQQGDARYYDHFPSFVARFFQIAAIVGILLATAGYTRASEALVFPAIYTVQMIAFLVLLHRFYNRLFAYGRPEGSDDKTLWPLVLSASSILLASPVFLLIWGMRAQEIAGLYQRAIAGFRVGEITISPSEVIIFVAFFSVGYALTRLVQSFLRNTFLPRTRLDMGGQNAIVAGVGYVGITVAAIVALNNTGIDLGSIALVASALSVGIGFGLQTIVSNFVSGIILLIERPIAEGDWIEVNGQMGYVRDISVRSTRVETFDRTDVIVPNSDLVAGTVTNYTRGNTVGRVIVPVGVAYGTDPRLVEQILLDVANAHPMVLAAPAPYVVFQGFGASSLDFEIRAILRDVNWVLSVRSDMNYEITKRFMDAGIEIPFPQQDIWLRNPETIGRDHKVEVEPLNEAELREATQAMRPSRKGQPDAPDSGDGGGGDGDR